MTSRATTQDTLYQVFGLSQGCSDAELKRAFYALIKRYHPDHNPEDPHWATERTREITEAYGTLKELRDLEPPSPGHRQRSANSEILFSLRFEMVSSSARSDLLQRKAEFESAWKALRRDRPPFRRTATSWCRIISPHPL